MKKNVLTPTDIMLPEGISLEAWSVVACDQFSSEREYWERVGEFVGKKPSTLHMIIPEAYLEEIDEETEISRIRAAMEDYLNSGILKTINDSFVYVERTQPDGRVRRGLVGAVDLEEYDFSCCEAAILASEGTVLDRLPPRIRVRREALLELPHIMTFIDDRGLTVIEPISTKVDKLPVLYDFELMEGGGRVKGLRVSGSDAEDVMAAMRALHEKSDMLMVMGDGNHSLAAAKVYWDELKQNLSEAERENHPARRALVEVNNVYDPAIDFEAIHRVLFDVEPKEFIAALEKAAPQGSDYTLRWVSGAESGTIGVSASCIGSLITLVQEFIDEYIETKGCRVDYIHGDDSTERLASGERSVGIILPSMDKSELFATVAQKGVFPRKSFSVGHARDKRYYLECKRIV